MNYSLDIEEMRPSKRNSNDVAILYSGRNLAISL